MKTIEQLQEENAALVAQVEHLISSEPEWAKLGAILGEKQADSFKMQRANRLRELRADAVLDFIEFMYKSKDCQLCSKSLDKAKQYFNQVRQGEVK